MILILKKNGLLDFAYGGYFVTSVTYLSNEPLVRIHAAHEHPKSFNNCELIICEPEA